MARHRLTPRARAGFRVIIEYVEAEFGVRVAERVVAEFEVAFGMLADNPGIDRRREDLTRDDRVRF